MEFTSLLPVRQSVRAYTDERLTEQELDALLNAAMASPVCMGKVDTVKLSVVSNPAVLKRLNEIAAETAGAPSMDLNYSAPTVIFVLAAKSDEELVQGCNAGAMMENMLLAAADLGLAGCYLFGLCKLTLGSAEAQKLIRTPEDFVPISAIAVGHPAQPVEPRIITQGRFEIIQ